MRTIVNPAPRSVRRPTHRRLRAGLIGLGLAGLWLTAGCAGLPFQKARSAGEVRIGGKDSTLTMSALQVENPRFADADVGTGRPRCESDRDARGDRHRAQVETRPSHRGLRLPAARAQEVLSDAGRASRSVESIARTVEDLPALVDEHRKAAIDQLFAGVAAEREAILAELEAKEARIQTLLGQLRETMNAGCEMGTSLTATIQSRDAFVHCVSPPPDPNAPPAKPGKPFDPLDFVAPRPGWAGWLGISTASFVRRTRRPRPSPASVNRPERTSSESSTMSSGAASC